VRRLSHICSIAFLLALVACGNPRCPEGPLKAPPTTSALASLPFRLDPMTPNALLLSYDRPATDWEREALPIGNGRLGAMVLGEPHAARFQFNVDSLWTGDENPSGEFDDQGFGNYQAFGTLAIDLADLQPVDGYRRTLDLQHAVHVTEWRGRDGTLYRQEAFASFPAEVIAVRLAAAGPSKLRGTVTLSGTHDERVDCAGGELRFSAALANGLRYAATVQVEASGGRVATNGARLDFDGVDSLVLYLAAATDYRLDAKAGFRGPAPEPPLGSSLSSARAKGFERLRDEHVADYTKLFGRVDVDFGHSADAVRAEAMDRRIAAHRDGRDPELIATLFQYGRYLLIASSRDNDLPANLQGIWNRVNNPPWHSDYHTNINIQMNYWLAGPTNLSECERPLFRLLDETLPAARTATRKAFGANTPGFTYRTSHNIFGGQGWEWNITANAWYALHYFEHYAFTGDREFLRARAFPYLTEASEFWLHRLKRTEAGGLVAPDGWSPEHGPREDGVTYDQELIWQLFDATLAAGAALESTLPLLGRVREAQARLVMPKIGRWGQLQEWREDRDDPADQHRHTSHLIGVYPGTRISVAKTPELSRAAAVSLRARGDNGDSRRSWTWPWRCALWARLATTECHRMIDGYIAHNLLPNLIATHPPLQLDGSYGISAGISEMLLQSHAGELVLLPGVEYSRWPRGAFRGLRGRGGFEVSARWEASRLQSVELGAQFAGPVVVRSAPTATGALDSAGHAQPLERLASGAVRLLARAGETYRLKFD
jgi:alpha-L-fucosidase 2